MALGLALLGGSIVSGLMGMRASSKAAAAQTAAADQANATQRYMYDKSIELSEPSREIGNNALRDLYDSVSGGFEASPGYQFVRDQGEQAIGRMASARGTRFAGSTLKDSMRFNTGLASQEYGNYQNRLAQLAGVGGQATSQQINAGTNYANAFGQNAFNAGQARASGYINQNNALSSIMNNGFSVAGAARGGMLGETPFGNGMFKGWNP